MITRAEKKNLFASATAWGFSLAGLYLASRYSFPLFHSLVELTTTAFALAIFLLVWNVRRSLDNNYLLVIGVAYLFVGGLELTHTLAYKGMGLFAGYDENLPTQLWVAARYVESLSLLAAPLSLGRRIDLRLVVSVYALSFALLLGAVFLWGLFPDCYVEGEGLTAFKRASEYVVAVIYLGAIGLLVRRRQAFAPEVYRLIAASIGLSIASELLFSSYEHVYGMAGLAGHSLKILSFYLVYKAVIELGMAKPFAVLFRNLVESEKALKASRDELERRVEERTASLSNTCEQLAHQMAERARAEEAQRRSELKYRIVADHNYDWEWWRDPEGRFVYVSPSCKRITDHSPEEFAADPGLLLRIVHPEDLAVFEGHLQEVEEPGLTGETEFRIVRPDGEVRWIAHACVPVYDEQGRLLGRRGSNRDISQRKEAERSLAESEERYRTLVESMNEGIGIADENGSWTYANRRLCEMLGGTPAEIVGRPVAEWLPEEVARFFSGPLDERLRGAGRPHEIAWRRRDGSTVHALLSPTPFPGQGRLRGGFAVITDITEMKRAQASLERAYAEIRTLKDRLEAENVYFRQESEARHQFGHIIGRSNALKYVLYRAEQVAETSATVLVLGETGTGKELIASAIHQMSPRRDKPLITVNCAALPPHLIESELFGRERGAYTGADARQIGRFELADGSTLCLDEIGEMPLEVQAKLLRAVQHNEFERLGSSRTIRVDVRIVATTNRDLEAEVRRGRFRQDLYYRLNVYPITIPPLRQRKEDIPLLATFFVEQFARRLGKSFTAIHAESVRMMQEYDWPGNVRELKNVLERAVILCPGPIFRLPEKIEGRSADAAPHPLRTLEEVEREHILRTLAETRWRINGAQGAAAILGLHPSTLRARMQKLGIRRPEPRLEK